MSIFVVALLAASAAAGAPACNVILFVPDHGSYEDGGRKFHEQSFAVPRLHEGQCLDLRNGHELGDTADFGNTIYTDVAFGVSVTPFR